MYEGNQKNPEILQLIEHATASIILITLQSSISVYRDEKIYVQGD